MAEVETALAKLCESPERGTYDVLRALASACNEMARMPHVGTAEAQRREAWGWACSLLWQAADVVANCELTSQERVATALRTSAARKA